LYDFGAYFIGPFLCKYMQFVLDDKDDYLPVCLSREGWLFHRTLLALSEKGLARTPQPPVYLRTSRAMLFRAYLCDQEIFRKSLNYKFMGTVGTLLLDRYALTAQDMSSCFSSLYLKKDIVLPDDKDELFMALREKYPDLVRITQGTHAAYSNYLHELGLDDPSKKIVFLDLGYSGSIQTMLTKALARDTHGKYFVTTTEPQVPVGEHTAYLHGAFRENVKWDTGYALLDRSSFLESVMTAPHGQLIDVIQTQNGQRHFVYGRLIVAQRYWGLVDQIHSGAVDYVVNCFEKGIFFDLPELEELYDAYTHNKDFFPGHVKEFLTIDDFIIGFSTPNLISLFLHKKSA